MLKKTISYLDFLDNPRTEDHYFHITKSELVEWNLLENGTLFDTLEEIGKSNDGKQLVPMFKRIVGMGYGKLSDDGKTFDKDPSFFEAFTKTRAWDELYVELVTDVDFATTFVNGLIPPQLVAEAQKESDSVRARPQLSDRLPRQTTEVKLPETTEQKLEHRNVDDSGQVSSQPAGPQLPFEVNDGPGEVSSHILAGITNEQLTYFRQLMAGRNPERDDILGKLKWDAKPVQHSDGDSFTQRPPHESGLSVEQA